MGIGAGVTFIPSIGIMAHHFQKRRTLAMTIVASGSSVGGVLHPIMLNRLIHGEAGFAKGVRASAGLNLGLLVLANLLMRTRLPPRAPPSILPALKKFSRDGSYLFAVVGYVGALKSLIPILYAFSLYRYILMCIGVFYPLFFLQLDAIEHGINSSFAFYLVRILSCPIPTSS